MNSDVTRPSGVASVGIMAHAARVLLLVCDAADVPGNRGKIDGLTKLAKLDFLVRYPQLAAQVLPALAVDSGGMPDGLDPMIRYKYGPWDDRYYPIIGSLVGRGLVTYRASRRGSVALAPTKLGRQLVRELRTLPEWHPIAARCQLVATETEGLTGNELKELIYRRLPTTMDVPHRRRIG